MRDRAMRAWVVLTGCAASFACAEGGRTTLDSSEKLPPWRRDVILWSMQLSSDNHGWRRHEGLSERFHPEYPDDLEVLFPDPRTGESELMWVSTIAFDSTSGEYLGVLLNSPEIIPSLRAGDNVSFHIPDTAPYPVAVEVGDDYRRAGLPTMLPPPFFDAICEALNHYRQGNFGHNPPGIDAAIAHFRRSESLATRETDDAARYVLHFFLARCLAEKHQTLEAIAEFERAAELRPLDEDARMGLLAELSVMAHTPPENLKAGSPEVWTRRFETEVAAMRERFPPDAQSNRMLDDLLGGDGHGWFDGARELTTEERALIRRIGAGPFRWKMK